MGSPFKTTVSKLYGLSPIKDVEGVDTEVAKKYKPVVDWFSKYLNSGTHNTLAKGMVSNLGAEQYFMDEGERTQKEYADDYPYQIGHGEEGEEDVILGPSIQEQSLRGRGGTAEKDVHGKGNITLEKWYSGTETDADKEEVMAHELGHTDTGFYTPTFVGMEINKRNKAFQALWDKVSEEQKRYFAENPHHIQDWLNDNYGTEPGFHDAHPAEARADLIRFRYIAERAGVYKSTGDFVEFTEEDLKNMKQADPDNRLYKNFEDKDIIWLMNNIAMNKEDIQDFTGEKLDEGSALTMRVDKRTGF